MSDSKTTQLSALADPVGTDVLPVVDDPGGAATTKKMTLSVLAAFVGNLLYPVGKILISHESANPSTYLGFGTWVAAAVGRFIVGVDSGDVDFDAAGNTGGAKTVTLTEAQIPAHAHLLQRYPTTTGASSGFTADTSMSGTPADVTLSTKAAGGGGSHPNVPPYHALFVWRRSA